MKPVFADTVYYLANRNAGSHIGAFDSFAVFGKTG
jgi:hypothetical protein